MVVNSRKKWPSEYLYVLNQAKYVDQMNIYIYRNVIIKLHYSINLVFVVMQNTIN